MNSIYYDYPYVELNGGVVEQREFGFITSKVVRPMRVGIGKTRRKIANKLYQPGSIVDKMKNAERRLQIKTVGNETLMNNLIANEAPKAKTMISFDAKRLAAQGGGGTTVYKRDLSNDIVKQINDEKYLLKGDKEFINKIYGDKNIKSGIAINKKAGEAILAHELGHAQGITKGGLRGLISRSDPRNVQNYTGTLGLYNGKSVAKEKVGFLRSVKDHLSNVKTSKLIQAEENAATRSGLKMLKRNGATKEELRAAKDKLSAGGDTYKLSGKYATRTSLGRIIDIPSRRGQARYVL